MSLTPYEQAFPFVIDDAAYEVGRGARPLAIIDVSEACFLEHKEAARSSAEAHGVIIEWRGEAIVAAQPFVLELYLLSSNLSDPAPYHGLVGLLLGYSPAAIQAFIDRKEEP